MVQKKINYLPIYYMDYKIVIPSKDRVEDFKKMTYDKIIIKYGLDLNNVYVFVPKENEKEYNENFGKINIVVAPNGFMNTVKYIHKYFDNNQKFVYMNDDITRILKLKNGKLIEVSNFKSLIKYVFNTMVKEKIGLAGFYPVANTMFMENQKEITKDLRFIFDALHFQINYKNIELTIPSKLDFETTIKYYEKDGGVLRFNKYTYSTRYAVGRVANINEDKDTKEFIKKYNKYISKSIKHKNGTTSFIFKKNVDI